MVMSQKMGLDAITSLFGNVLLNKRTKYKYSVTFCVMLFFTAYFY